MILFNLLLICLLSCSSWANVDSLAASYITNKAFPGVVIGVLDKTGIKYMKAYGTYTYDSATPMATSTLFDLASVSKVIATTSVVMKLYEQGKLKLEDKVVKYIPEFGINGKENITIMNLMIHDSGMEADHPFEDYSDMNAQTLMDYSYNIRLSYATGTAYLYSDFSMIIMMEIIKRITGMGLDQFSQKYIFEPMGMIDTVFNPKNKEKCAPTEIDTFYRHQLLQGIVHDEKAFYLNGVGGSAGLYSPITDMMKFMQMMINYGEYDNGIGTQRMFEKDTIVKFTTRVVMPYHTTRAIGWDTNPYGSICDTAYGHTGYTGTSIYADQTRNGLSVVLLTNRVDPSRYRNTATLIAAFRREVTQEIINTLK